MKNKFEIFIDTDILLGHLSLWNSIRRSKEDNGLAKAIELFDGCYTSVINASEVFAECSGVRSKSKAKELFRNIGILGIPFRYSLTIGEMMRSIKKKSIVPA